MISRVQSFLRPPSPLMVRNSLERHKPKNRRRGSPDLRLEPALLQILSAVDPEWRPCKVQRVRIFTSRNSQGMIYHRYENFSTKICSWAPQMCINFPFSNIRGQRIEMQQDV